MKVRGGQVQRSTSWYYMVGQRNQLHSKRIIHRCLGRKRPLTSSGSYVSSSSYDSSRSGRWQAADGRRQGLVGWCDGDVVLAWVRSVACLQKPTQVQCQHTLAPPVQLWLKRVGMLPRVWVGTGRAT